jgi:hypothetical protein
MGTTLSGGTESGRLAWYDRAPTMSNKNYQAAVGPHGATSRFTYTVPAGKKAIVEILSVRLQRETVASPAATASIYITYTPSGGSASVAVICVLYSTKNAIGDLDKDDLGTTFTMNAGDAIECRSSDGSTGGTISYMAFAKVTEYEA